MVVHRITFTLKPDATPEAIAMLNEAQTIHKAPHGRRIVHTFIGGIQSTVVMDMEFENLSELEGWWAEWWSLPEAPAFMEKWHKLQSANTTDSVFNLVS